MAHPRGRQPIGVNQPPIYGTDFPFVAPSSDVEFLLADFYLAYVDRNAAMPLRLVWLHGFGTNIVALPSGVPVPTHTRDLLVKDAVGNIIFDSTIATSYFEKPWAGRLLIIEWRTDTEICRCVMHTEFSPQQTPIVYDSEIVPVSGELAARTYEQLPKRVGGIRVGTQTMNERLVLQNGFNIDLETEEVEQREGERRLQRIVVTGTPGGGLGRQPDCTGVTPLIRTINGVRPNAAGNFVVDASECFRNQPPLFIGSETERTAHYGYPMLSIEEAKAAMILTNNCRPCCSCDAFVHTYAGLRRQWFRWQGLAAIAESIRDTYNANRDRWLAELQCRLSQAVRLITVAEPNCKAKIAALYCNFSKCCLTNVELRFTLQVLRCSCGSLTTIAGVLCPPALISGSYIEGCQPYNLVGRWPVYSAFFQFADPQRSSMAQFRVCIPNCTQHNLLVTVTAHVADPCLDSNGQLCVLPLVTVPADIQAIWTNLALPPTSVRGMVQRTLPLNPAQPSPLCEC